MSVWFMRDNHTFLRLDQQELEAAFDAATEEIERLSYGCLFEKISSPPCPCCGANRDDKDGPEIHLHKKDANWRGNLREYLKQVMPEEQEHEG